MLLGKAEPQEVILGEETIIRAVCSCRDTAKSGLLLPATTAIDFAVPFIRVGAGRVGLSLLTLSTIILFA